MGSAVVVRKILITHLLSEENGVIKHKTNGMMVLLRCLGGGCRANTGSIGLPRGLASHVELTSREICKLYVMTTALGTMGPTTVGAYLNRPAQIAQQSTPRDSAAMPHQQ